VSGEDVLVADVVIRVPRLCQRLPNVVEPSGDEPGSAFTPDGSVNRDGLRHLAFRGGDERTRTADPLLANQVTLFAGRAIRESPAGRRVDTVAALGPVRPRSALFCRLDAAWSGMSVKGAIGGRLLMLWCADESE
jgi:hypothetical protein